MIDSISTSLVQSAALRPLPQGQSALQAEVAAVSSANLPTWRIRMDNHLDRAIIEVRASDNGQVLRQYPTEAQLRAFARAESLKQARQQEQNAAAREALAGAQSKPAPAPKAQAAETSAPSSSDSGGGASATSTQSIEV